MSKRLTTEEFIKKSGLIHGDKYSYIDSEYVSNSTKITVSCPFHGKFEIMPKGHMSGKGCMKCAIELRSKSKTMSNSEFIRRAKEKHGDRYDYSKSIYKKSKEKLVIICETHGEFLQCPDEHLKGSNCKLCSAKKVSEKEFIDRSIRVHKNKYSYEDNGFSLTGSNVTVTCHKHGRFKINANSHLRGHGCRECAAHNLGWRKSKYVEFCKNNYDGLSFLYVVKMKNKDHSFYKIGISVHGHTGRYKYQKSRYNIEKITEIKGDSAKIWTLEKILIRKLKKYRINFKTNLTGGDTECFSFIDMDIISGTIDKYLKGEFTWQ